jgi:hypothetical protein
LSLTESILPVESEPSVLACGLTLHMAEMYDLYAAQYFYNQDEPIFQELVDKALEYCDEGQRMVNTFGEVYQRDILFSRPWSLRISISMTLGDLDTLVSFVGFFFRFFLLIFVVCC